MFRGVRKMKALFLGCRKWAVEVYDSIKRNPHISNDIPICSTEKELFAYDLKEYDLLITCGWSEELGSQVTDSILCIGAHCAELDRYSYGTPIQLQIIDGINFSKHRLFKFVGPEGSDRAHTHTREYSHEVDLDFTGSMDDILSQMTSTTISLFNMFLEDYPNIEWKRWEAESLRVEARVPTDSYINMDDFSKKNTLELYNLIRCLESPYPNLCLEDDAGYLYFEKVRYKKK